MADATQAVTDLEAAVTAEDTVEASAETLIVNLNQALKDALAAGGTPQEIVDRVTALSNRITARTQVLADAVTAGTPAAPTP